MSAEAVEIETRVLQKTGESFAMSTVVLFDDIGRFWQCMEEERASGRIHVCNEECDPPYSHCWTEKELSARLFALIDEHLHGSALQIELKNTLHMLGVRP